MNNCWLWAEVLIGSKALLLVAIHVWFPRLFFFFSFFVCGLFFFLSVCFLVHLMNSNSSEDAVRLPVSRNRGGQFQLISNCRIMGRGAN